MKRKKFSSLGKTRSRLGRSAGGEDRCQGRAHCSADEMNSERSALQLQQQPSCEGTHDCLVASDLLAAVVYENGHWVTGFQGRMEKLLAAVDADPESAATPRNSKFQGSPTCGQFWIEGDPVSLQ